MNPNPAAVDTHQRQNPPEPSNRHGIRALVAGLVIGWLALSIILIVSAKDGPPNYTDAPAASSACADPVEPAPKTRATLTAAGAGLQNVAFGISLNQQRRRAEYVIDDASGPLEHATCLNVEAGPFIRDTGDAELNPGLITVATERKGDRVMLLVAFDRTDAGLGPPGSYAGMVTIVDPRVERVDIPVTVTLSYPEWRLPLGLFFGIMLPAAFYVWLLKGSFQSRPKAAGDDPGDRLNLVKFFGHLYTRNGFLGFGVGSVAAAGALVASYYTATTWNNDPTSMIKLIAAMFSSFVAAATTVVAAGADKTSANG